MLNKFFVLIVFVSVITVIFFEKNSHKAVNFVVVCYILTMVLNIFLNFKLNFDAFKFNIDYSSIYNHADDYKKQYNIFFDDIRSKEFSGEKNK